jgi:hypothetical protein
MAKVKIPGLLGDSTTKGYNLMNETQAKMLMMEIAKTVNRQAGELPGMYPVGGSGAFSWAR